MRLSLAIFTFLILLTPSFAFAQDAVHQHGYQEIDYGTYPPEMMDSYIHVQDWLQNMQGEVGTIMKTSDPRVAAWRDAILALPMDNERQFLNQVNRITNNAVPYVEDSVNYQQADYWATPIETLLNGGDCEDIALLKAFALYLKKWDTDGPNNMHLLMGLMNQDNKTVPHAALEVDTADDDHYVLSNMIDDALTFDDMNLKMKPLYMVDATGVVAFVKSTHSLASLASSAGAKDGETVPIEWDSRIKWDERSP